MAGFLAFDARKAAGAGLRFRPVEETIQATLEWAQGRPDDHEWRAGINGRREKELLSAWDTAGP